MGGNSIDEDDFTVEENLSFTEKNCNTRLDREAASTERSSDQENMEVEKTNDCSDFGAQFESRHAHSHQFRSNISTHSPLPEKSGIEIGIPFHENLCHNDKPRYKCTVCKCPYRLLYNLHNHMITHSVEDSPHACETCGKKFPSAEILDIHVRTHKRPRSPSSVGGQEFGYQSVKVRHMETHTQVNHIKSYTKAYANCSDPEVDTQEAVETGSSQDSREQQMSLESPVQYHLDAVKTEMQTFQDEGEEELKTELTQVWSVSNVGTQEAVETGSNQDSREQQMSMESPVQYPLDAVKTEMQTFQDEGEEELKTEPTHACNFSAPSFDTFGTEDLVQDEDPVTDFMCPLCSSYFQGDERLHQHIQRSHSSRSSFSNYLQCPVCDNRFEAESVLKIHVQFHLKSNFNCLICGRVFIRKPTLDTHLKGHRRKPKKVIKKSKKVMNKCQICHKSYVNVQSFRKHMQLHAAVEFKEVSVKVQEGFDVVYSGADELYEPMCELSNDASKQAQDPLSQTENDCKPDLQDPRSQTENDCKPDLSTAELHSDEATFAESLPEVKMEFYEDDCKDFKKELSD